MPRKAAKTPREPGITLNEKYLKDTEEKSGQQIALSHRASEIYDAGQPYERTRIISEARFFIAASAQAALELGRRLILLKENEPHGEFIECLAQVGVEVTAAKRVMKAALKFSNSATSHHLIEAAQSKSKLFELMLLDDEDLAELAEGGTVMELELDDVSRMTVRELRDAVRAGRQKQIAMEQVAANKDDLLNKQDVQLHGKKMNASPDEDTQELLAKCQEAQSNASQWINQFFRECVINLKYYLDTRDLPPQEEVIAGMMCEIERCCEEVRADLKIKKAPNGTATKDYMLGPEPTLPDHPLDVKQ